MAKRFEYICEWLLVNENVPGYDGRHDVNFLTDIHEDNFLDNFLFFEADRLDELDFICAADANFLTVRKS